MRSAPPGATNCEPGESVWETDARPCQLLSGGTNRNSDKVYRIRIIRKHLVDCEQSETVYLVIRDDIIKPNIIKQYT